MAAHVLDLNTIERPTLRLTLTDKEKTTLNLIVPDLDTVQEMQAVLPLLSSFKNGDLGQLGVVYETTAKLLSCNAEGVTVTADDLRGKYRMRSEALIVLYSAYADFIASVSNAKN